MRSWLPLGDSVAAALDTSERCEACSPNTRRLSNTHCIDLPGSPTNGSSMTTRSYQRLTVTIGIDPVLSALWTIVDMDAGTSVNNVRSWCQGTVEITARATV